MTNQFICGIIDTERGERKKPREEREITTMTKTIYRVFHLDSNCWIDRRTGEHNDFTTIAKAIEYRNEAKNYRDRDIDVVEKTFDEETFTITEKTLGTIRVD